MSVAVDDKNSSQYIIEVCKNKGSTFCGLWNTDDFILSECVSAVSKSGFKLIAFFIFSSFIILMI